MFVIPRASARSVGSSTMGCGMPGRRPAFSPPGPARTRGGHAGEAVGWPARRRDADSLIELLNCPLEVVTRFENGIAVEDELDIGIELDRLALDRRGLANRLRALNRDQLDAVLLTEGARVAIVPSVLPSSTRMMRRGRRLWRRTDARHNTMVLASLRRGDDHIHCGLAPILSGSWRRAIRSARQTRETERGIGASMNF